MFELFRKLTLALTAIAACVLLTACGSNDKELLAAPEVGDNYAAQLTHFESFRDKDGKPVASGYGLMKVTKVTDKEITVITSTWYNENSRGIEKELTNYHRGSEWDISGDAITITRADLPKLYEDDKILAVNRPKIEQQN